MNVKVALLLVVFAIPLFSHAQAFKCRTPSGKVEFSDSPCAGGAQTERVQSNEYISPERQRQAREVQARNASEVNRIEGEKAAYGQQMQRQQAAYARADAEQARIDANKKASENVKAQQDECSRFATDRNMGRSQRAALAELCARPEPNKEKFDDCKAQLAKATSPSQRAMIASNCTGDPEAGARVREVSRPAPIQTIPPSVITSCDKGGCWDDVGNRYNGSGATLFRADGKTCQKIGNMLECN